MTDQPDSPLRQQIADALTTEHYRRARERIVASPEDHCAAMADAVLAAILPGSRITATLARMSEADVQRVIALYERWVKAGPPPLGTLMSRWWDARLVELRDAILPPEQQPDAGQSVAECATGEGP